MVRLSTWRRAVVVGAWALLTPAAAGAQLASGGASSGPGLGGTTLARPGVAPELPRYVVTEFAIPDGYASVFGLAIDDTGVATGYALPVGGGWHPVPVHIAADGAVTLLPSPTGDVTVAWDGAAGLAVGHDESLTPWSEQGAFPYAWNAAGAHALDVPPGDGGAAYGVNEDGLIVGYVASTDPMPVQYPRPCAWDGIAGPVVELQDLGAWWNPGTARAVNAGGQICGWAMDLDEIQHAVRWDSVDGAPLLLDAAVPMLDAWDINDRGDVAGHAYAGGKVSAVLYEEATSASRTLLPPPGWTGTIAYGLNDRGLVVGQTWTAASTWPAEPLAACCWLGASSATFDALLTGPDAGAYEIRRAWAVNDAGQVVADARRVADGVLLGVRLDPVPFGP